MAEESRKRLRGDYGPIDIEGHRVVTPAGLADRRTIVCNFADGRAAVSTDARAYVLNPDPGSGGERCELLVRSRGGRWIRKWESTKRLRDFRWATVPPEHPLYDTIAWWLTEDHLADLRREARVAVKSAEGQPES